MRVFLNTYLTLALLGVLGTGIVTSLLALKTGVQLRDQLLSSASETYVNDRALSELQMYLDRYERLIFGAYFEQRHPDQFRATAVRLHEQVSTEMKQLQQQLANMDEVSQLDSLLQTYFTTAGIIITELDQSPINHLAVQYRLQQMLQLEQKMHPVMADISDFFDRFERNASTIHNQEISRLTILTVALSMIVLAVFSLLGWLLYLLIIKHSKIRMLQAFPEYNPHPVMSLTKDGQVAYANPASYQLLKVLKMPAQDVSALLPKNLASLLEEVKNSDPPHRDWFGTLGYRQFQYRVHYLSLPPQLHVYMEDVTEQERIKNELVYRASHDPVTRLYNRFQLYEDLQNNNRHGISYLLLIQFHGYEDVLSSHGQNHVDMVSSEIAERVNTLITDYRALRAGYRWADEVFGMTVLSMDQDSLLELMEKIRHRLARPYGLGELEFLMRVRIASTIITDNDKAGSLISRCQTALRLSQDQKTIFYHPAMGEAYERQRMLEKGLETALERDELHLYFQPQVSLSTGLIVGAEALLRWQHPGLGNVSPDEFIPVAEATGIIIPIGDWVLRQACEFWGELKQQGIIDQAVVAVNLSAGQFRHTGLVNMIRDIVSVTGMPYDQLELEITESHLMHDLDASVEIMKRLQQLGVALAIDDFGTGYSSLSTLNGFPLDKLKIDRSFVVGIPGNRSNETLVEAIIQMAHALNLKIITEGVETKVQVEWLKKHGSNEIQGYYFSKPLPRDEFVAFIQQGQTL
ncbi:putative bifunctional diguanylate cyclase/phosphodiesterase [Gynuella sunshinyii]|uniref:putative bifunctional diguanylate cyclase/phosphodiesterase n=1 Tax=Gynuella sunshinyii TaxID=1445505 RepID=UPI0014706AC8|nr:GGDEF domain-containing phosphodiesterase [Gynuella sunshinyii]